MTYLAGIYVAIATIYVGLVIVLYRLHRNTPKIPLPQVPKSHADRQWDAWWAAEDDEVAR